MRLTRTLLLLGVLTTGIAWAQAPGSTAASVPSAQSQPAAAIPPGYQALTLADAQALAVKNNPQISVARLLALAQHQVSRQVRSAYWPTANGYLTAVEAHDNTRITA